MFSGKRRLVDSLNHDLARTRNKRDALASGVTTLSAEIAELEVRLSAKRIVGVKNRLRDHYLALAGFRDATEAAAAFAPEAREITESLDVIAGEVANSIDSLLGDLDRRIEAVRAGNAELELPASFTRHLAAPQNGDPASIKLLS
jgi:hypothetical protein